MNQRGYIYNQEDIFGDFAQRNIVWEFKACIAYPSRKLKIYNIRIERQHIYVVKQKGER